jgi:hypothetical protein
MGVPEACRPNCIAGDRVFPEDFAALGIESRRPATLARGAPRCESRFGRKKA